MSLGVTLTNALSGMRTSQQGLDILSRNVANSGTPGYHRQSLVLSEVNGSGSSHVRLAGIDRAFSQSLQSQILTETGRAGATGATAEFMSRLELLFGKPGDVNSLDTQYSNFENSLTNLAASPEDFAARSEVVSRAQTLAGNLNYLSNSVQEMRRETEAQISSHVADLNRNLSALQRINEQLVDTSRDDGSRMALLDERDRLLTSVSDVIDVRVAYNENNGTVNVTTKSGIGLLDVEASIFEFENAGNLSPHSLFNRDPNENGVGTLTLRTPSGLALDLVSQNVLQSGRLAALVDLRDNTLVEAQAQLDEIAAGLSASLSTTSEDGTAVSSGGADGFELDLSTIQPGNSFTLNYTESGDDKTVRVVRIDDPAKLPLDETDADGVRTIGLDFSGGIGAVASALDTALGAGISVSNPSGDTIQILDDGAGATTDVNSLSSSYTVTGAQDGTSAMPLFTDGTSTAYTGSLDGSTQRLGFAARIQVNQSVLNNNSLLVKYDAGTAAGDNTRPNFLLDRLSSATFEASTDTGLSQINAKLSGNVRTLIEQTINYQGNQVQATQQNADAQNMVMESLSLRQEEAFGVDVDTEMARLIELQNSYAANARVVAIAKELIDTLLSI
ncbi:flagellar hook-associated protein FlgK [Cucumibacter marinus]|uniref:flagellar hook-associated protein FlgK n=1 Tax=Cucumibacter marinus TaxID=1121252 RepID=UPI00041433AF|nr:flagellar hook-associated protein FlgK [Cucumibacter marinus]